MTAAPASTQGRMEPIATLPVFFKLGGKRALLAGGSPPAVWKAELLAAAGARVTVYAADPCAEMLGLVQAAAGTIALIGRTWTPADLAGAAIALGAIDDETEAAAFQVAARAAGVPVNVIDRPAYCDFQFGTIVSRPPLVIGISTDGAAPVFGQAIRARLEALLPQSLRRWAEAARDWRPSVQDLGFGFQARRRFWEAFSQRALATPVAEPTSADYDACLRAAAGEPSMTGDRLTLVGAGPGAPDAVTLMAIRALQSADVVLHGGAVSPVIIGFARREALKVAVLDGTDPTTEARVLDPYRGSGRKVAWLDGGNPATCLAWARRHALAVHIGFAVDRAEGLGTCARCAPGCPAWQPKPGS